MIHIRIGSNLINAESQLTLRVNGDSAESRGRKTKDDVIDFQIGKYP